MERLKVYTASKLKHFQKWRDLRDANPEIIITSRWIDQSLDQEYLAKNASVTACLSEQAAREVWRVDHEDVAACDVVLVYAEESEHLRGALVEAGMGLALGKTIMVVGDHPDYGTWQYHTKVTRAKDLDQAVMLLGIISDAFVS